MGNTEWFDRKPGESASQSTSDPHMVLIGSDSAPDWVRLPPELGGRQVKVTGGFGAKCPKCRGPECQHLVLDADVCVAECGAGCGFVWYGKPKGDKCDV